jgi:hypothetical protein
MSLLERRKAIMSTRLAAGWAALALLLAGTPQPSVLAKPPGLPIDPKVKYQESPSQHEIHSEPIKNDTEIELAFGGGQAGQHGPGTLLFGIGLNSQTGVVCNLTFAMGGADSSSSETSDLFSQVLHLLLDQLDGTHGFIGIEINGELSTDSSDMEQVTPAAKETKPSAQAKTSQPVSTSCPYLQRHRTGQPRAQEKCETTTVLQNITKLEEAQALYQKAESARAAGNLRGACKSYQEIQQLCPGSRFEQLARQRLADVQAQRKQQSTEGETEEEETNPIPWWPSGTQVRCTVWLGGLSVTTNAGPEGHGSLMFGLRYESLTDAAAFLLEHGDMIVDCLSKSFGGE